MCTAHGSTTYTVVLRLCNRYSENLGCVTIARMLEIASALSAAGYETTAPLRLCLEKLDRLLATPGLIYGAESWSL